jgi:2,3-bisphosphoglycerate-independent phosphoglycerate mutase
MKYAVLVGDGMADYPLKELDGCTPLEAANTPNMDEIAQEGQLGLAQMIPPGFAPGSDVAILSILGYDPRQYYTGRGPLEAASLGIELAPQDVAFRCNLITVEEERITDYSGGHISTTDGAELIRFVAQQLGTESIKFFPGVSYRHLCVIKDENLIRISCTAPHDALGEPINQNLPQGEGAEQLIDLMERSYQLLSGHKVNRARLARGQNPANMLWFWGQGTAPQMPSFTSRFGIGGGVITAVDLVKGIARLIGLEPVEVPGATGYYDTNYEAKADHALRCLEKEDFVLVHVEATDEASHNADLHQKIKAIESFDHLVVGPIKKRLGEQTAFRILVLPDHSTPLERRTHTTDPVPFAWCGQRIMADEAKGFGEQNASKSTLQISDGYQLMERFING